MENIWALITILVTKVQSLFWTVIEAYQSIKDLKKDK